MKPSERAQIAVQALGSHHVLDSFDCGKPPLNRFLQNFALASQASGGSRTYVTCRSPQQVVGYYTLAYGSINHDESPPRVSKGLAKHPIPVMILARLAVDLREQGRGIGEALLKDAILRTIEAGEIAGIRAILVHAKDSLVQQWYEKYNFMPSSNDPNLLFLLNKDFRKFADI